MSAQTTSLLGYGMYFIDVLACLLFCITLALVGARFGREHTVAVDLPEIAKSDGRGGDVTGPSIVVRSIPDGVEILLDGVPVTLAALAAQLEGAPPPSVVVRSEESTLHLQSQPHRSFGWGDAHSPDQGQSGPHGGGAGGEPSLRRRAVTGGPGSFDGHRLRYPEDGGCV